MLERRFQKLERQSSKVRQGAREEAVNKKDIIDFFDRWAPHWDEDMIRNESVISEILDRADIREGIDVLDVACGTGVLFPDYLSRKVASLTGIDISPEMVRIASSKFPDIEVVCGDVITEELPRTFDSIVVYNAFPHFPEPERLIAALTAKLKPGGRLTIAHGMSRESLNRHHSGAASKVSVELMHEDNLAKLMERFLVVDMKISDDEKYIVSAKLR